MTSCINDFTVNILFFFREEREIWISSKYDKKEYLTSLDKENLAKVSHGQQL